MVWHSRRALRGGLAANAATARVPRRTGRPPVFLPPDFEPVLPAQWFAGEGRWLQPAERLMLAVLTDAIELILEDPAPLGARRRAAEWVRSDDRHWPFSFVNRSEEHTSELQSRSDLVCRLLLEKK